MKNRKFKVGNGLFYRIIFIVSLGALTSWTWAFPEFQAYSERHSGRPVNCGLCHVNPDGPSGNGPGQLGRLTPEEMQRVNQSRGAREPGQAIDNPILNPFGDHIIQTIGSQKLFDLRRDPAGLATALGSQSDLDGDGISDAREYLDGTDPLNPAHGAPGRMLAVNLRRHAAEVLFGLLAFGLVLAGLTGVIRRMIARDELEHGSDEGSA